MSICSVQVKSVGRSRLGQAQGPRHRNSKPNQTGFGQVRFCVTQRFLKLWMSIREIIMKNCHLTSNDIRFVSLAFNVRDRLPHSKVFIDTTLYIFYCASFLSLVF
jgi:hypothetical protein